MNEDLSPVFLREARLVVDGVKTMEMGIIGRKLGMTQVFSDDGAAVAVTVVETEPSVVIQKKTMETDGYEAIQLGYGRIKRKNVAKPLQGHFKKADKGNFRFYVNLKPPQAITLSVRS
jgi:large subunit ribosomal protein L3